MKRARQRAASAWWWWCASAASPLSALAADVQDALPELTVTVNKQAESVDAVAGSASVLPGEEVAAAGARGLEEAAAMTPGFTFQSFGQSGVQPPVMRGLTANFVTFSSSTLLLVDGVPTLAAQGFEHDLNGVERVEVLRGPQSTLYGRNAEAGVVAVHTRLPGTDPYALVATELGSRGRRQVRADASRALVADMLFVGVAGNWQAQDGFMRNLANGRREDDRERSSGRLVLRWTPGGGTEAVVRYARQAYHDGAAPWGAVGAPRTTVRSGTPSFNHSLGETLSLDLSHVFSDTLRLRSITARNVFHDRVQQDTDFQPVDALHLRRDYRLATVSQELRLEGRRGGMQWLAGLYADHDDNDLHYEQKLPTALSRLSAALGGHSTAGFAHATVPLASRWTLALGGRLERSTVALTPQGMGERSTTASRLTPKVSLQHQWTPQQHVYASFAQGFRAGGFNVFAPAAGYSAYRPEVAKSYEVGARGQLPDQRLRCGIALYRMDVDDMQVQQMASPGVVFVSNATAARSTGADVELEWQPGGGWHLRGALGLNRTRFGRFRDGAGIYDGHRNPFAPDATASLLARHDTRSGWFAQAALRGAGRIYLDAANRYRRPGYAVVDVTAGRAVGAWEVAGYVRNLADRRYDAVGYLNGQATVYSPPREWGVRLTWRL